MNPELDFPHILDAAQAGGEWAFDVLFRHYQPLLLRYLRAQEPRAAEDLAAEVWMAVAPRIGGFRGDESGFRGWLFTVARRRLIEHRRKAARRRTDPVPAKGLDARAAPDDPAAEVAAVLATQEAVDRLVARLVPDQAEVVLLRVVAGLSVAGVRIRYELRVVGAPPRHFVFDDGNLTITDPGGGPVDCYVRADPVALNLIAWGRMSPWPSVARGRLRAWGRRPWLAARLTSRLSTP